MSMVETLTKSVAELKAKVSKTDAKGADLRGLRKQLRRAQRRLRQASGKKLAAIRKKHGGEQAAAPAAGGEKK